jgi:hypothetical protein
VIARISVQNLFDMQNIGGPGAKMSCWQMFVKNMQEVLREALATRTYTGMVYRRTQRNQQSGQQRQQRRVMYLRSKYLAECTYMGMVCQGTRRKQHTGQ